MCRAAHYKTCCSDLHVNKQNKRRYFKPAAVLLYTYPLQKHKSINGIIGLIKSLLKKYLCIAVLDRNMNVVLYWSPFGKKQNITQQMFLVFTCLRDRKIYDRCD